MASINPHHLHLFYNLGRYGGLQETSRKIHMEVSGLRKQLIELEEQVGFRLFERKPFALTRAGQRLYQFAYDFFEKLPALINQIKLEEGLRLAVGAPTIIARDHLAKPVDELLKEFPNIELDMEEGDQESLEEMLQERQIDVAVTILDTPAGVIDPSHKSLSSPSDCGEKKSQGAPGADAPPVAEKDRESSSRRREETHSIPCEKNHPAVAGSSPANHGNDLCALPLLQLPLALVVPAKSKWKSADEFLSALLKQSVSTKLLLPPPGHTITRHFRDGLKTRGITEFPTLEMKNIDFIESYAREGLGIGVSVAVPRTEKLKGVRILPLKDFALVTLGILWRPSPSAPLAAFIKIVEASSRKLLAS